MLVFPFVGRLGHSPFQDNYVETGAGQWIVWMRQHRLFGLPFEYRMGWALWRFAFFRIQFE
jgi:hypothetical protein